MNTVIRFIFCAFVCLSLAACHNKRINQSSRIALILKAQGVFSTNSTPDVFCYAVSSNHDKNGFNVFIKGGLFVEVNSFLQTMLGNTGIALGKNNDGFEMAAFHKTVSRPGFLVEAEPNGVLIMGIR
jgi:hypothetical protein